MSMTMEKPKTKYSVAKRAMLVSLSISKWQATKKDKKISSDVAHQYHIAENMGSYSKRLLAEGALTNFGTIEGKARQIIYKYCLPWGKDTWIIPNEKILDLRDEISQCRQEWDIEFQTFYSNYDDYVDSARIALNGAFDPKDYPSKDKIARKFGFALDIDTIPEEGDFRAELSGDAYDFAVNEAMETRKRKEDQVVEHAVDQIKERVEHMIDRLKKYTPGQREGNFKSVLLENMEELINNMSWINITGNEKINELVESMRRDLCGHSCEALKESEEIRDETLEKAEAIMKKMSDYGW